MVDLSNKITNNSESEKHYDFNLNTTDLSNLNRNVLEQTIDNFSESFTSNFNNIEKDEDISLSSSNNPAGSVQSDSEVANCLALTVKKDYNLTIVKNVFIRTLKNTWRIALSIFTLNMLKFFL